MLLPRPICFGFFFKESLCRLHGLRPPGVVKNEVKYGKKQKKKIIWENDDKGGRAVYVWCIPLYPPHHSPGRDNEKEIFCRRTKRNNNNASTDSRVSPRDVHLHWWTINHTRLSCRDVANRRIRIDIVKFSKLRCLINRNRYEPYDACGWGREIKVRLYWATRL